MTVFSEIYGTYFRITAKILEKNIISEKEIRDIISRNGFRDTILFLEKKIIPQKDNSDWGFLKKLNNEEFERTTKNPPVKIFTLLQKKWLKAKLSDPKIRLFLDDNTIFRLNDRLAGVAPLYRRENFHLTDMYENGDDFTSEKYRENFGKILSAVKNHEFADICFKSSEDKKIRGRFLPLRLEYSRKENKFRVCCYAVKNGCISDSGIIQAGRIESISLTGIIYDKKINMKGYFLSRRCRESVTVCVTSQRNGIERFLTEFSSYEKNASPDPETGGCIVKICYDRQDEDELLDRLLGFGPVIEIVSPPRFRNLAAERVKKQYDIIFGKNKSGV